MGQTNTVMPTKPKHTCECGFIAKTKAGLSAHKRHCKGKQLTRVDQNTKKVVKPTNRKAILTHELLTDLIEIKGLTQQQAGTLCNVTKQAVSKACKKYGIIPGALKLYKQHKADMLAQKQQICLTRLSPETIKKVSPYQAVGMYNILSESERLERGLSTANVMNIHADIEAMRADQAKGAGSNVPGANGVIDGD